MLDRFSSVENMLRWQIDNTKRRVAEMEAGFKNCGELSHCQSKPTDRPIAGHLENLLSTKFH